MLTRSRIATCLLMLGSAQPALAVAPGVSAQRIFIDGGSAYCIATDSHDDVWLTNTGGWITRIDEDTLEATRVLTRGFEPLGPGQVALGAGMTLGIAIDSQDNVYFSHGDNLWKRSPEGTQCDPPAVTTPCLRKVVRSGLHRARGLWPVYVDASDNVYTAGAQLDSAGVNPRIAVFKLSPGGEVAVFVVPDEVAFPGTSFDIAIDDDGNMFVTDVASYPGLDHFVHRFTPTQPPDYQRIATSIVNIGGLEVDSGGRLYVSGDSVWRIETSVPGDWSEANLTRTRLSPPGTFGGVQNSTVRRIGWGGLGDVLFTTGIFGHTWKFELQSTTPPLRLLEDSGPRPRFTYGMDVIESRRGYLYLSTEGVFPNTPAWEPSSLWRLCADLDTDMLCDDRDNCTNVDNAETGDPSFQLDADHDGYGNACDADLDQSGVASLADYGIFLGCFAKTVGAGAGPPDDPTCAESDSNGDGTVGLVDYGRFQALLFAAVGPSGVACTANPPTDGSCP